MCEIWFITCLFSVCGWLRHNSSQTDRWQPDKSGGERLWCHAPGCDMTGMFVCNEQIQEITFFLNLLIVEKWKWKISFTPDHPLMFFFLEYLFLSFSILDSTRPPAPPTLFSPCPPTEPLIYEANNSCDDFISHWCLILSQAFADRTCKVHLWY